MNASTDVLAFESSTVFPSATPREWGDIFIAPAYVRRSATTQGVPYAEELARVTSHGILHLLGFDHCTPPDAKKMFPIQERIVRSLSNAV